MKLWQKRMTSASLLPLGSKSRAALAAAHGEGGEAVLEGLLKAEELDDGGSDGGVEAQAALVGADGAVELHAEAAVDADLAVVVHPGDGELDEALRLHKTLDYAVLLIFGVLLHDALEALEDLQHRLVKLRLARVPGQYRVVYPLQILVCQH